VQTDVNNLKVLGYLGRALSLELSAVQMYTTQARLVSNWGLDQAAEKLRLEAQEEIQHVERIIARMLAVGAAPNASQLRPVKLGPDLLTLLQINKRFEMELVELYQNAVLHCARSAKHDDRLFFQALLEEEQHHADELSNWMAVLETT
jgi:bacterioferritin